MIAGCVVASFSSACSWLAWCQLRRPTAFPQPRYPAHVLCSKTQEPCLSVRLPRKLRGTVFHVDEKIKGVTSDYFDLEPYPISGHFEIGKEYLVFVDVVPLEDGEQALLRDARVWTNQRT